MREILEKVYLFDELSDEAKAKAIEDNYTINVDEYDWYDFIYDRFIDDCVKIGISVDSKDIRFSGFYTQGDGASFEGEVCHNVSAFLKYIGVELPESIAGCIYIRFVRVSSHYCHENTCTTELEAGFDECGTDVETEYSDILETIRKKSEQVRLDLCRRLYSDLEQAYEELTSDESIAHTLIANEYEFYETGEQYY